MDIEKLCNKVMETKNDSDYMILVKYARNHEKWEAV